VFCPTLDRQNSGRSAIRRRPPYLGCQQFGVGLSRMVVSSYPPSFVVGGALCERYSLI
jgi:hypothetical protein